MAHNPHIRLRPPNLQEDVQLQGQAIGNDQGQLETLIESFSALADEVQNLIDRRTILEHKLRYAHEQFQHLADKYAPGAAEISEKLAQLQLPPDSTRSTNTNFVPLPKRDRPHPSHHEIAVLIREGRRAARQLNSQAPPSKDNYPITPNTTVSNMSTILWQDFTVEGKKKGKLECPFSAQRNQDRDGEPHEVPSQETPDLADDPTPHRSNDPICAAMFEETMSQPAPANGANKCPIRFFDQHSPEEIAQYVEKHKHEIPRSHEVCVRRYQKNEDQIKKLDAKYGSLVGMIQDLSHLHQPMLPSATECVQYDLDQVSNQRLEAWAQDVVSTDPQDPEMQDEEEQQGEVDGALHDRESHFDRPFREIRVGESPTRPWGISVPNHHSADQEKRQPSPAAPPIRLPPPAEASIHVPAVVGNARKCPFDHTKLGAAFGASPGTHASTLGRMESEPDPSEPHPEPRRFASHHGPSTPIEQVQKPQPPHAGPTFISPSNVPDKTKPDGPQMLFTGPVFIGYPMEQAIEYMKQMRMGQRHD